MDSLLRKMLKPHVNPDVIEKILNNSYDIIQSAFVSKAYNETMNYEFFEQLGDLSINKFVVNYMSKRFPQLRNSEGVGILAKLRILYASKEILSKQSEKYGFDKFIKCSNEERMDISKYRSILEDVFEAFFGAVEYAIDKNYFDGLGYITVYKILEGIYNEIDISIEYEKLVDAKSRLNELKDEYKLNIVYKDVQKDGGNFISILYLNNNKIGSGESHIKKNAQIIAAEVGLKWIKNNMGIIKEVPAKYKNLPSFIW